jgi:F-box/LRR-repeat protein
MMIDKKTLIEKAQATIDYNNSLVEDDAAVAMLGISRIVNLKNEIEELKVFIKVLNRLI